MSGFSWKYTYFVFPFLQLKMFLFAVKQKQKDNFYLLFPKMPSTNCNTWGKPKSRPSSSGSPRWAGGDQLLVHHQLPVRIALAEQCTTSRKTRISAGMLIWNVGIPNCGSTQNVTMTVPPWMFYLPHFIIDKPWQYWLSNVTCIGWSRCFFKLVLHL